MNHIAPIDREASMLQEDRISELREIDALIQLYRPAILRFAAFSTGDADAAETITQDCFLKAHATQHTFRGDCGVKTWLMRIAVNLIRSHTRKQKFQFWKAAAASSISVQDAGTQLRTPEMSPEAQLIARQRVQDILEALNDLTVKQRSVFLMRFVEDMDIADIAGATGMNSSTVKTHLSRALGAIRARFGGSR